MNELFNPTVAGIKNTAKKVRKMYCLQVLINLELLMYGIDIEFSKYLKFHAS